MSDKNPLSPVTRREAFATVAIGVGLMAKPAILRAQTPLTVNFVQQRGLLYLPVDEMVSGGILQQEATKLGLGKVEATVSTLSGPAPVMDALLSGSADYGTAALPSLLTFWDKTHGTRNEVRAVGTVSNGAMVLYTINPNVKTVAALSAGYGRATITAHIGVQPFTSRGLKLPGAHVLADSREVFGGPLTQITLLASKQTKEKNPILFKGVANALEESIRVAGADKRAAAILWKKAQNAPESVDDLVALLDDPGFEFTSEPHRIAYFAAFLNRIGSMKAKVTDWKELFWETAHNRNGD
jgi:sulfonate transport system substrate-binding protein